MSRHEITNYGFAIVDNLSMTKPYNYDLTVMDIFNITLKTHIQNLIVFPFWQNNLEANIFKSSHFCQPLFEDNFTITPEEATKR